MKTSSITKNFLFHLFLFLSLSFCYGQKNLKPGYIIDLKYDTVRGFVDFRNDILSSSKCVFYDSEKSQPKIWLPGEISAYRIDESRFYISKQIKSGTVEKTVFLEFLVKGITSLYYLKTDTAERYFIQKGNELYELNNNVSIIKQGNDEYFKPSNQYKGLMRVIYSDSKEIVPEINNARFDKASMMKLSEKYHSLVCTDMECIVYEKDKKGVLVNFGPVVRYEIKNSTNRDLLAKFKFNTGHILLVGFAANLNIIAINDKFNVAIEGMFRKENYESRYTSSNLDGYDNYSVNLKKTGIQTNIIFKYRYPKGKIRPSFGIGPELNIITSQKSDYLKETFNLAGDLLKKLSRTGMFNYKYEIGFSGNAGLYYMLKKNMFTFDLFCKLSKETYREIGTIGNGKGDVTKDAKVFAFGLKTGFLF
jgi:hypothetical protein